MQYRVEINSAWYYCQPCDEAKLDSDGNLVIELNSLEELMAFIEKYGRVVIDEDSIEIYDTYTD